MKQLLKVLVGSQAHGLATPESDFDYRGVFQAPTDMILSIGHKPKTTDWIEGKEDNTSWELGHFLMLATKCNPTILETFLSPVIEITPEGQAIRDLFPKIWNSEGVMNAFVGYGHNQRTKFIEEKDGRPNKFAAAYLRSLYNGWELLSTGTFTVKISETPIGYTVRRFKNGEFTFGEVIDTCRTWEAKVKQAFIANPAKETDIEAVNKVLLDIRYGRL